MTRGQRSGFVGERANFRERGGMGPNQWPCHRESSTTKRFHDMD